MNKITQEYLKECCTYNAETGVLTWTERPDSHFIANIHTASEIANRFNSANSGNEVGSAHGSQQRRNTNFMLIMGGSNRL